MSESIRAGVEEQHPVEQHDTQSRWIELPKNPAPKIDSSLSTRPIFGESYKYTPLQEGEIRLLLIGRAESYHAHIHGTLINVNIEKAAGMGYEALSYAWGTEATDRRIYIDEAILPIKPNLEAALHVLRDERRNEPRELSRRLIWIDAICVNQADDEERNQQVSFMCTIYSRLESLVVWLGESSREIEAVVFALKTERDRHEFEHGSHKGHWCADFGPSLGWYPNFDNGNSTTFDGLSEGVLQILTKPWFQRAWVMQEFVLGASESTVLYCGRQKMSWPDIQALATWFRIPEIRYFYTVHWQDADSGERYRNIVSCSENVQALSAALIEYNFTPLVVRKSNNSRDGYNSLAKSEGNMLLSWLIYLRETSATDPRDKIFAVLGLVKRQIEGTILEGFDLESLVDYRASVQGVYSKLVQKVVNWTGKLDILLACCDRGEFVQRSWVPDWSMRGVAQGLFLEHRLFRGPEAAFKASNQTNAITSFAHDLLSMSVTGFILDTVDFCYPSTAQPKTTIDNIRRKKTFLPRDLIELRRRHLMMEDNGRKCGDDDFVSLCPRSLGTISFRPLQDNHETPRLEMKVY